MDVGVEEVATPEAVVVVAAAPLLLAAELGAETAGAAEPGEAAAVVATLGVFAEARRFAALVAEVGVPVPEAGADAAKLVNGECACEME